MTQVDEDVYVEIIPVIVTRENIGEGTKENPIRCLTQYWTMDGVCLETIDPYEEYEDIQ